MLWNQYIYKWYNSPTKYLFNLQKLEAILQFHQMIKKTTFDDKISMKFYTYKKKPLKKNLLH
jgi:hypothetical protein